MFKCYNMTMVADVLAFIEKLFQSYGAFGVFVASIIEEVIAPIPSSVVTMSAGFALIPPDASALAGSVALLFVVAIPSAAGMTIGSSVVYGLAYWLGNPFFERWGTYVFVPPERLEKARARFTRGATDEVTIVALRTVPLIPSVVLSALCGILRISPRTYLSCTFIGSLIRAIGLGFIGWQAQSLYTEWAARIGEIEHVLIIPVVALALIIGIVFLARHMIAQKKAKKNDRAI